MDIRIHMYMFGIGLEDKKFKKYINIYVQKKKMIQCIQRVTYLYMSI